MGDYGDPLSKEEKVEILDWITSLVSGCWAFFASTFIPLTFLLLILFYVLESIRWRKSAERLQEIGSAVVAKGSFQRRPGILMSVSLPVWLRCEVYLLWDSLVLSPIVGLQVPTLAYQFYMRSKPAPRLVNSLYYVPVESAAIHEDQLAIRYKTPLFQIRSELRLKFDDPSALEAARRVLQIA